MHADYHAGERPPVSEDDWIVEFSKYQASPEFKRLNSRMALDDFRMIYWIEYAHRMWGRALGVVFVVPAAFFAMRGYLSGARASRLAILFAMGGAQVCRLSHIVAPQPRMCFG
jgi:cytochrome c oxidase assembly protein subunit 15